MSIMMNPSRNEERSLTGAAPRHEKARRIIITRDLMSMNHNEEWSLTVPALPRCRAGQLST